MLVISCYIHDELAAYHPIEQVALFIATLTSFIIQANTQLKRDPADIANDLLKAMYIQMIAQSNNPSIPPADPDLWKLTLHGTTHIKFGLTSGKGEANGW